MCSATGVVQKCSSYRNVGTGKWGEGGGGVGQVPCFVCVGGRVNMRMSRLEGLWGEGLAAALDVSIYGRPLK